MTAGLVAASGLLGHEEARVISFADCNVTPDDARLVASATDSQGTTIDYWRLESGAASADLISERLPEGGWTGGSMACGSNGGRSTELPWAAASLVSDDQATLARLYGWVPQQATAVVVTLSDGTTITTDVGDEGFFLHPVTLSPDPSVEVTHIQAFTSDGTLIADSDLP